MAEQDGTPIPPEADPKGNGPPEEKTDHTQPPAPPATAYNLLSPKATKKRVWIYVVVGVLVIGGLIGAIVGTSGEDDARIDTPVEETVVGNVERPKPVERPEPAPKPEPLPVPEPNVYPGSGDSVIAIEKPESGPAMFHITGNTAGRHFAVTGYDAYDNRTSLFVNTTDPYEGFTLDPKGATTMLEVSATGAWTVGVHSVRAARIIPSPGSISGTGDEVLQVGGSPNMATIRGNPNARHFAVIGYNPSRNLMVNTTDVYEGTVRVARNTTVLEITAVGAWEISLE